MPSDSLGWVVVLFVIIVALVLLGLASMAVHFLPSHRDGDMATVYTGDAKHDNSGSMMPLALMAMLVGLLFMAANFAEDRRQLEDKNRFVSGQLDDTREALIKLNLRYTEISNRLQEALGKLNEPPPYCSPVAPSTPITSGVPRFGADSQFHRSGRMEGHGIR